MTQRLRPRLRAPILTAGVGLALAVAVAVAAGWMAAAPVAVVSLTAAAAYYWLGGTDTDAGAMIACRADERQRTVRLQVRALAGFLMFVGASAGALVAALAKQPAWPYAVIVGIGVLTFVGGLILGRTSVDLTGGAFPRLDERRAAVFIDALQRAGVVMFLAAAAGSVVMIGRVADDAFRYLAVGFAGAVAIGFAVFWPRPRTRPGTR